MSYSVPGPIYYQFAPQSSSPAASQPKSSGSKINFSFEFEWTTTKVVILVGALFYATYSIYSYGQIAAGQAIGKQLIENNIVSDPETLNKINEALVKPYVPGFLDVLENSVTDVTSTVSSIGATISSLASAIKYTVMGLTITSPCAALIGVFHWVLVPYWHYQSKTGPFKLNP